GRLRARQNARQYRPAKSARSKWHPELHRALHPIANARRTTPPECGNARKAGSAQSPARPGENLAPPLTNHANKQVQPMRLAEWEAELAAAPAAHHTLKSQWGRRNQEPQRPMPSEQAMKRSYWHARHRYRRGRFLHHVLERKHRSLAPVARQAHYGIPASDPLYILQACARQSNRLSCRPLQSNARLRPDR